MVGMKFRWLKEIWPGTQRPTPGQPMISNNKYERLFDEVRTVLQLANHGRIKGVRTNRCLANF
jgi:hypothetical protein